MVIEVSWRGGVAVHLQKLAVGAEGIDSMRAWQGGRLRRDRTLGDWVPVTTRMRPRREEELLDGGSLFWVIRGTMCLRQKLLGIDEALDQEGRPFCVLQCDPDLVETVPVARKPFQGWRYLKPEEAPADRDGAAEDLPAHLERELRDLGVL